MKYKITITKRAKYNIVECVDFVRLISESAAKRLMDEILFSIESLTTMPFRFPEINQVIQSENTFRKISIQNGRYSIIYAVSKNTVTIYDILDSRKDNKILKSL